MVKVATKGQKEIYEENKKTIKYYSIGTVISCLIYGGGCSFLWTCDSTAWIYFVITILIQGAALLSMKAMAASRLGEKGQVVDAGLDLNDPTAFGEYCKDAIILTVLTQIVGLYSNYAFLLLLFFPIALGYKFIFSILLPWATSQSDGGNEEMNDKKARKRERREKIVYRR